MQHNVLRLSATVLQASTKLQQKLPKAENTPLGPAEQQTERSEPENGRAVAPQAGNGQGLEASPPTNADEQSAMPNDSTGAAAGSLDQSPSVQQLAERSPSGGPPGAGGRRRTEMMRTLLEDCDRMANSANSMVLFPLFTTPHYIMNAVLALQTLQKFLKPPSEAFL